MNGRKNVDKEVLANPSKKVEFKIINKNRHKSKLFLKDPLAHSEMIQLLRQK